MITDFKIYNILLKNIQKVKSEIANNIRIYYQYNSLLVCDVNSFVTPRSLLIFETIFYSFYV